MFLSLYYNFGNKRYSIKKAPQQLSKGRNGQAPRKDNFCNFCLEIEMNKMYQKLEKIIIIH